MPEESTSFFSPFKGTLFGTLKLYFIYIAILGASSFA